MISPVTKAGIPQIFWWATFAVATVALSSFIRTFKDFSLSPSFETGLPCFGATFLFLAALMLLMYDGYVKEREKGNIKRPFSLFEWVLNQQIKKGVPRS